MCLATPLDLLLCEKKTAALLSQYIISGLLMLSTTLRLDMKFSTLLGWV
jgi:hypothetical protein